MTEKTRGPSITTTFDEGMSITWFMQTNNEEGAMRFFCRDLFDLAKSGLKKKLEEDNSDIDAIKDNLEFFSPDKAVIITGIAEGKTPEATFRMLKAFTTYHGGHIIGCEVAPAENYLDKYDEEWKKITIDGVKPIYSISNKYAVRQDDFDDGVILPCSKCDTVTLEMEDGSTANFDVSDLVMSHFEHNLWDEEFNHLFAFFKRYGFENINDFCEFEYSVGHVWTGNSIGELIARTAHELGNNEKRVEANG